MKYVISTREFSGPPSQVLAQLDELIDALVAFRQQVVREAGAEPHQAPSDRTRPARAATVFLAFALAFGVASDILAQPAQPVPAAPAAAEPAPQPADAAGKPDDALAFWKVLKIGLGLEGYYEYNDNRPPDRVNGLRAYDTRANTFGLQQASVILEVPPDVAAGRRAGMRLDLQFGQATSTVQGSGLNEPRPDLYRHVWQAFGSFVVPVGRGLRVDVGKFASNLGYETNYAKDNQAYSRAYLFNFLPFYHSGVRATVPLTDRVTLMYMLTNGIQQTEEFNDFKSHHVTAILAPMDGLTWTTSLYAGQEQPDGGAPRGPDGYFRVIDSYVAYSPSAALSFGADLTHVTNEVHTADAAGALTGLGLYARVAATPGSAVAVRYEFLDDTGGLFGGVRQDLQELTVTAERVLAEGFLVRAEFRRDWSDRPFFAGRVADRLERAQHTVLVGLVWWAGNKKGAW